MQFKLQLIQSINLKLQEKDTLQRHKKIHRKIAKMFYFIIIIITIFIIIIQV